MNTPNLLAKDADPTPLYHRLKEILRQEIEDHFEPHQRFHSVRELVARHGVSTITVTRTLRDLVEQGHLYARQGKGTFVSPRRAEHRPSQRMLTISLPMTDSLGDVLAEPDGIRRDYLRGIADAGRQYGAVVEFCLVQPGQTMDFFLDLISRPSSQGVVLYGTKMYDYRALLERAVERGVPYVAFQPERAMDWPQVEAMNLHYVTSDQHAGLYQATEHLIALGHRNIAFWQHERTGVTRQTGYRQAMADAKLPVDPKWVRRNHTLGQSPKQALRKLLSQGVTALATASDFIAFEVLDAAREMGLDVPGEFSVTGFDNNPAGARRQPPLTSVMVDRHRIGTELVKVLIQQFRQPESPRRHQILVPTQLVVRQSTGPCVAKRPRR